MKSPETPEDVFVVLMDFIDDMELYGRNPKAFKELLKLTLKQRAQQMRLYLAAIPREKWLDIHRMFMFAPDMKELLEELVTTDRSKLATVAYKADSLLETMEGWTEPPFTE